jgi:hypothetical protein
MARNGASFTVAWRARRETALAAPSKESDKLSRGTYLSRREKELAVVAMHKAEFGVAEARGSLQYGGEDLFQLARRRTDDVKYFGCGHLLLQRRFQLARKPCYLCFLAGNR